jgi:hypothetical protein
MSTKNTHPVQADGKDALTVQGYGTLDYRISAKDYFHAIKVMRNAGLPAGGPTNGANSDTWPFDGVIARE